MLVTTAGHETDIGVGRTTGITTPSETETRRDARRLLHGHSKRSEGDHHFDLRALNGILGTCFSAILFSNTVARCSACSANKSNSRPSCLRTALRPVSLCQRRTIASQYFGESSTARHFLFVRSAAMMVVPEPQNGSYTYSPTVELFRIGRAMHSIGFCVPCPQLPSSFSVDML